jgi:hypothetical protein
LTKKMRIITPGTNAVQRNGALYFDFHALKNFLGFGHALLPADLGSVATTEPIAILGKVGVFNKKQREQITTFLNNHSSLIIAGLCLEGAIDPSFTRLLVRKASFCTVTDVKTKTLAEKLTGRKLPIADPLWLANADGPSPTHPYWLFHYGLSRDETTCGFFSETRNILARSQHSVSLALNKRELPYSALNCHTLFSPLFPQITLHALSSSSAVITTSRGVARMALACSVPAILIENPGTHPPDDPIPQLVPTQSPYRAAQEIERIISNYPWKPIRREIHRTRMALSPIAAKCPGKHASLKRALNIACICDQAYLPFFRGLVENLILVHGKNLRLYLLALDLQTKRFAMQNYASLIARIYGVTDLHGAEKKPVFRHGSFDVIAYASKPKLIDQALTDGAGNIFYTDLDVFYFRSPIRLFNRWEPNTGALLFPHWNHTYENTRLHGCFNAGMIAAAADASAFLRWWGMLCDSHCAKDTARGYYDDQAYLDLAAVNFPEISIYRGRDENVAAWNITTLGVRMDSANPGTILLDDGKPVASFHAPQPDRLGLHEAKFSWDQLCFVSSDLGAAERYPDFLSRLRHHFVTYWPSFREIDDVRNSLARGFRKSNLEIPKSLENFLRSPIGTRLLKLWKPLKNATRMGRRLLPRKHTPSSPIPDWVKIQKRVFRNFDY